MPSNGGEFSSWLDGSAHIACVKVCKKFEIVSDKKKRAQSRACALTRRTAYDRTNDSAGSLPLAN